MSGFASLGQVFRGRRSFPHDAAKTKLYLVAGKQNLYVIVTLVLQGELNLVGRHRAWWASQISCQEINSCQRSPLSRQFLLSTAFQVQSKWRFPFAERKSEREGETDRQREICRPLKAYLCRVRPTTQTHLHSQLLFPTLAAQGED